MTNRRCGTCCLFREEGEPCENQDWLPKDVPRYASSEWGQWCRQYEGVSDGDWVS